MGRAARTRASRAAGDTWSASREPRVARRVTVPRRTSLAGVSGRAPAAPRKARPCGEGRHWGAGRGGSRGRGQKRINVVQYTDRGVAVKGVIALSLKPHGVTPLPSALADFKVRDQSLEAGSGEGPVGPPPVLRGRRRSLPLSRPPGRGRPRQPRSRAATRGRRLLRVEHPHQPHERVRGHVRLLRVRREEGRASRLHDEARRDLCERGRAARSPCARCTSWAASTPTCPSPTSPT